MYVHTYIAIEIYSQALYNTINIVLQLFTSILLTLNSLQKMNDYYKQLNII